MANFVLVPNNEVCAKVVEVLKDFQPSDQGGDWKDRAQEKSDFLFRKFGDYLEGQPDGGDCPRAFGDWMSAVYATASNQ